MKIKLLITIFLLLVISNCFGQIMFQKVINGNVGAEGYAVQQTTDNGYIIAGYTTHSLTGDKDIYIVKTNANGDTIWTKAFGGAGNDVATSVQQTWDSGFIIAGYSNSFSASDDVYIIKTDVNGDIIWTKTYGGVGDNQAYSIEQTNDSGYIITGVTNGFGAGYLDFYLLKINGKGDITWTKTYGSLDDEFARCVKQTIDSGYIIVGYTSNCGVCNANVYLIKTNANGDTLWTKTYGGNNTDIGNSVEQTTDSGYIVTGFTTSFGAGSYDVYLIKTNAKGDTLWTKTFGGSASDQSNYVHQTSDGGYIICASSSSFGNGNYDVYLIRTNSNGDTLWTKTYGGNDNDLGNYAKQTSDGGYIITGLTASYDSSQNGGGIYLIKTDANGNSGCNQGTPNTIVLSPHSQVNNTNTIISSGGTASPTPTIIGSGGNDSTLCLTVGINEQNINNTITLYPNPATDFIYVKSSANNRFENIQIINILGQVLLNVKPVSSSGIETINVSNLADGIYCFEAIVNNQKYSSRFIISR